MTADKEKVIRQLKTVRGQVEGLLKMVEEDRYCIDISNQLMATQAILRNVNRQVLHAHLQHCVKASADSSKIDEIMNVVDKLTK